MDNYKNIFDELVSKQIQTISISKKLRYRDLIRLSKYIKTSIFDKKICSLWHGYISKKSHYKKGTYINFYFKNKKLDLHRLLYENFVEELQNNEHLKYTCKNNGSCCNINHMKKFMSGEENKQDIVENTKQEIFITFD
jgi:hypothetical protein